MRFSHSILQKRLKIPLRNGSISTSLTLASRFLCIRDRYRQLTECQLNKHIDDIDPSNVSSSYAIYTHPVREQHNEAGRKCQEEAPMFSVSDFSKRGRETLDSKARASTRELPLFNYLFDLGNIHHPSIHPSINPCID